VGPHRDAPGGVDDLDRLGDGRPAAGDVGDGAGNEVRGEERVAPVDVFVA
jgi:hypothetical protein